MLQDAKDMYGMICCLAHNMKNPAALIVNLYLNELKLLSTLVVCNVTIISEVELCLEQNKGCGVVVRNFSHNKYPTFICFSC